MSPSAPAHVAIRNLCLSGSSVNSERSASGPLRAPSCVLHASTLEVSRAKMASVELLEIPFGVCNEAWLNTGDVAVDALSVASLNS